MTFLLQDVFNETTSKYPDNVAVAMESGRSISYRAMDILSNQFAWFFMKEKKEIRNNPYIGILSSVHIDSIAAVLGCLKVGGAYVPLDEQSPIERLRYIIRSTCLDVLVVDANLYEKIFELYEESCIRRVVVLNDKFKSNMFKVSSLKEVLTCPSEQFVVSQTPLDLAYVLHSSGSTGVPKGIMLSHRNARAFVDWMQDTFKLTAKDVVMSRAPFKFDLSVFDIFNTFKVGATLVCYDWYAPRMIEKKHFNYLELMARKKVTILYTTPSTFVCLMNRGYFDFSQLSLRQVMYAGEPFPTTQLKKLMKLLPGVKVANIYGPTETNIITYYEIKNDLDNDSAIPLGQAVTGTEIIIVNELGDRICDTNEVGELWCRGETVTLGYLGLPELTKNHLVESPFHKYPTKFWRTGDYGFYDQSNILHYKGRKDHMVKIKGYRIELGEIEAALSKYPFLHEYCVVLKKEAGADNKLCCIYSEIERGSVEIPKLKKLLLKYIPKYMLPTQFLKLKELPKTSSGKIDRMLLTKKISTLISQVDCNSLEAL